CLQTLDFPYSF
nr:immunoglobulin light chain junction region [Macaca mulatta]